VLGSEPRRLARRSRRAGAKRYDGLKRRLRPSCLSISFSSFRSTSRIVRSRESGVVGAGPGILANCAAIISLRFVTVRVRRLGSRPSGHKRRMAAKTVRWHGAVSVIVGGDGIGCSVALTGAARGSPASPSVSAYTAPDALETLQPRSAKEDAGLTLVSARFFTSC
jgi:hypothetical protein